MKKIFYISVLFLFATPASVFAAQERFVRVTADAEVMAPPDRVTITVGLQHKTDNLKEGAKVLQQNIAKALAYCRAQHIKDKNIQTQNVSINPSYYAADGKRTDKPSYTLAQSFSVTLEDLSQYETVLYGLLDNGINQVRDVRFYSSKLKDFRNEARTLAMQNAQQKAQLLAKEAHAKLGKVMTITEEQTAGFYGASNISQNSYINTASGIPAAGVIPVRAEITVQYALN